MQFSEFSIALEFYINRPVDKMHYQHKRAMGMPQTTLPNFGKPIVEALDPSRLRLNYMERPATKVSTSYAL